MRMSTHASADQQTVEPHAKSKVTFIRREFESSFAAAFGDADRQSDRGDRQERPRTFQEVRDAQAEHHERSTRGLFLSDHAHDFAVDLGALLLIHWVVAAEIEDVMLEL